MAGPKSRNEESPVVHFLIFVFVCKQHANHLTYNMYIHTHTIHTVCTYKLTYVCTVCKLVLSCFTEDDGCITDETMYVHTCSVFSSKISSRSVCSETMDAAELFCKENGPVTTRHRPSYWHSTARRVSAVPHHMYNTVLRISVYKAALSEDTLSHHILYIYIISLSPPCLQ